MAYRFKPNRAQKDDFIEKMRALEAWIAGDGRQYHAERAATGTVYFTVTGQRYRVASHPPGFFYDGEIVFHAAPTRAPYIADAIAAGKRLNKRGIPVE